MKTFVSFLGFIAVLGAALPAFSQSWPAGVTPVRGVVESISGDMLTVESQTGPVKTHLGTPRVVPMITIFAPEHSDQRPVRIWNRPLIGYAGYRRSDGTILGDPLNVPLTVKE